VFCLTIIPVCIQIQLIVYTPYGNRSLSLPRSLGQVAWPVNFLHVNNMWCLILYHSHEFINLVEGVPNDAWYVYQTSTANSSSEVYEPVCIEMKGNGGAAATAGCQASQSSYLPARSGWWMKRWSIVWEIWSGAHRVHYSYFRPQASNIWCGHLCAHHLVSLSAAVEQDAVNLWGLWNSSM